MQDPQHPPNYKWAVEKFHVGDFNVTRSCLQTHTSNFHEKIHNPERMNEHSNGRRMLFSLSITTIYSEFEEFIKL
jgi:hypothetical protein